ncbi:MAG: TonB family protein [Rhizobiales bacterium]|nr:TonB family protein [Hyphomicrobiales bacterium]
MNAPAEFSGHRGPSASEVATWALAALLALAAHAAFAYALRDMTPFQPPEAQEQALEIDLAPLPISVPDSVASEAVAQEEPVETVSPDDTPMEIAAAEPETLREEPAEAAPRPLTDVSEPVAAEPERIEETRDPDAAEETPEPEKAEEAPVPAEDVEPEPVLKAQADQHIASEDVSAVVPEMVEQETVEAENPEVVLPKPQAEPERQEEVRKKAETPPRKRPVRKAERKETAKPEKTERTEVKAETKTADKAGKERGKPRPSAASQQSRASKAPTVSPARWNSAVRAAVARSVGRIRGMRGSVNVSFVVGSSGGIVSARISRSSGDGRLDNAALNAVRSARVPAPPAGLGGGAHAFSIPLSFR